MLEGNAKSETCRGIEPVVKFWVFKSAPRVDKTLYLGSVIPLHSNYFVNFWFYRLGKST